jgi:hypothetical protein
MSYAPDSIKKLAAYWVARGGVNLGIVGDGRHLKGYHLGKDRIYDGSGPGLGDRDYSVMTARDRAGLTNAASAIDLGKLNGGYLDLRKFSMWLVKRCQAGAPGTSDIREVIYSPDGKRILRYDRQRGRTSAPREGEADASHAWHTHISFYRDSEKRDKVGIFSPFFAVPVPDTSTGEDADMPVIATYIPGQVAVVKASDGANVRATPKLSGTLLRTVKAGSSESWTVTGWVKGEATGGSDLWIARWAGSRWEYTHKGNVASVAPPADASPYTQAQLDAAVKAAVEPVQKQLAVAQSRIAAARTALG